MKNLEEQNIFREINLDHPDDAIKIEVKPEPEKIPDWNLTNVDTLYNWLVIASYNIMVLEKSIAYYRRLIQIATIWGLILSSSSGTIGVSQIAQNGNSVILNYVFVFLTYAITIISGYLKIHRVQDKLEDFIRVKQEWISFSTGIVSQMQLPVKMRQDAQDIILTNKVKYLELIKLDLDIPYSIKNSASTDMVEYYKKFGYADNNCNIRPELTDIIMGVASKELFSLRDINISMNIIDPDSRQTKDKEGKTTDDNTLFNDSLDAFGKWAKKEIKEFVEEEIEEYLEDD